jgi:excinuclease ABC subunit A
VRAQTTPNCFRKLRAKNVLVQLPYGACQQCHGLGNTLEISEDLSFQTKTKSIIDGALAVYGKMDLSWRVQQIAAVGKKFGFDVFTPIKDFTPKQLEALLHGTKQPIDGSWSNGASMWMRNGWEGVIPQTMRLYRQTESEGRKEAIMKFRKETPCTAVKG